MADEERDSTADWLVDRARRPVTVLELEGRIDAAMRIAEAAEAAAAEIGATSLEASEQARRAVALAERASAASQAAAEAAASSAAAARAARAAPPVAAAPPARPRSAHMPRSLSSGARRLPPDPFDERLTAFRERADRVLVRLRRLDATTPIS